LKDTIFGNSHSLLLHQDEKQGVALRSTEVLWTNKFLEHKHKPFMVTIFFIGTTGFAWGRSWVLKKKESREDEKMGLSADLEEKNMGLVDRDDSRVERSNRVLGFERTIESSYFYILICWAKKHSR
jgi:hypothetical protein